MQDFYVVQGNDSTFDIEIDEEARDYKSVDGMETAISFQLFVNKRSDKIDISVPRRRQGWMGDLITKDKGYQVGSLLYLKNQARNTQADKNEVAAYAEDALKYFVAIRAAQEIKSIVNGDNIEGEIKISNNEITSYSNLWRNTIEGINES